MASKGDHSVVDFGVKDIIRPDELTEGDNYTKLIDVEKDNGTIFFMGNISNNIDKIGMEMYIIYREKFSYSLHCVWNLLFFLFCYNVNYLHPYYSKI